MWIHACSNLEQGRALRPLQLGFSALKFSAAHLKKAAVANRARASNTNPRDNEPGGGRRWALSEEGAVLLLERPKRAINPQIQRRTQALLSWRKAWDVSAGRTNHAASPAEVASSAKPRSSAGYYTQILSICSRAAAGRARRHPCRHRDPPGPPHRTPATLPQRGSAFVPFPFQTALRMCPPKSQGERGAASLPLAFGCDTTASPDKESGAQHRHIPASLHIPRLPALPANPHTRPCSHVSEIH